MQNLVGKVGKVFHRIQHEQITISNSFLFFFRLIKCLTELKWIEEAEDFIETFSQKFPNYSESQALKNLQKRLDEVKNDVKVAESKKKRNFEAPNDHNDNEDDMIDEASERKALKKDKFEDIVRELKTQSTDFQLRFCGHCNTTTDIKEANFFGR